MKRSKPMKRTGFKRKATFGGRTKSGATYTGHGDRPMDAKSKAALANVMEAAAKQLARTPMRRRSKRMAALYAGDGVDEGRRAFVERILRERPVCQAGDAIAHWTGARACGGRSVDVHELHKRSQTGSKGKAACLLSDDNVLAVCRACHDWIETHGKEAIALGLARSRYAGRNA